MALVPEFGSSFSEFGKEEANSNSKRVFFSDQKTVEASPIWRRCPDARSVLRLFVYSDAAFLLTGAL